MTANYDVVILGGGLAGPDAGDSVAAAVRSAATILVIERRTSSGAARPRTRSASRRSRSARTTSTPCSGCKEHLDDAAAAESSASASSSPKAATDVDQVAELGASRYLATPSYQLDRGIFENFLGEHARALGVEFVDGAVVRSFELGADGAAHRVRFETEACKQRSRAPLAHRCLGPRRPDQAQARAGSRTTRTTRTPSGSASARKIDVDEWSSDAAWLERCDPPFRWLSTNHLCGEGYWAWLIPLVLRLALGRHRLRREAASARDHEHVREGARLVPRAPAAAARRRSRASGTCCRTSVSCATSPTAASRCSRAIAGR